MKRILLTAIILSAIAFMIVVASRRGFSTPGNGARLQVVATVYPVAEFARQVGGNLVTVTTLVPNGTEPHEYEPTPNDLAILGRARVLVKNGAGFEPWLTYEADKLSSGAIIADTSEHIPLLVSTGSATPNPHIWLDPLLAQHQVDTITDAFSRADPKNADSYRSNADVYKTRLRKLDTAFKTGLADCRLGRIVVSHDFVAYVARRYGLTVDSIHGASPEDEPSPRDIARLADSIKKTPVPYVLKEPLVPDQLAETLAHETGARILTLNPIEGLTAQDRKDGMDYGTIQAKNLETLRTAMECK